MKYPHLYQQMLGLWLTDIIKQLNNIVYVIEKNICIYDKNITCYFAGRRSPCGRAPSRTELRKCLFYVLNARNRDSMYLQNTTCCSAGNKRPCGSAPSPTVFIYFTQNMCIQHIYRLYV